MPKTPSVDPDAQAFLTASGITDSTISSAINTLVNTMKSDNIWSKMKAIYPMVGGTASTHKWNLKDPRDLDAAFRLQFFGGWTHSSNGALPNGVNGYADTFSIPPTHLSINSAHFSKYNRNNDLVGNKVDGCIDGTFTNFFQQNYSAGNAIVGNNTAINTYTQSDTRGLFTVTRTASNNSKVFKNSTQQGSANTTTISSMPNIPINIGCRNNISGRQFYNSYECAFASIGDGLTDTDIANLYTAVQAFQTTLNRQIV